MADDYLAGADVWTVLDLIAAEFKSDPRSVQCFDRRIVDRAIELVRHRRAGMITFLLDIGDRDAVVLALAILSLDRPGWLEMLRDIARQLGPGQGEAFDELRRLNADRWHERPLL